MLAALGVMPQLGSTPARGAAASSKSHTPAAADKMAVTRVHTPATATSSAVKREPLATETAVRDPSKVCKCKKSKCVRQYCVCFRAGLLCEGCECSECLNDGKHEIERLAAIEHIKTSDPLAFVDKIRPEVCLASYIYMYAYVCIHM